MGFGSVGGVGLGFGVGVDGAQVQGAEGAGAEGTQGVKRGDDGARVLQQQAARRGESQDGAERAVEGLDFDLAVAGERCGCFEGEGDARGERDVVGVGEGDRGVGLGLRGLAEERDDRAWRGHDDRARERAAVAQRDDGGEMVVELGGRRWSIVGQCELQGVGLPRGVDHAGDGGGGLGAEGEVAEGEAGDLVESCPGDEQGLVAGVELDGGDVGGFGEGAGGEHVGFGLAELLKRRGGDLPGSWRGQVEA